ncbi:DNA alkylation repair protein [Taibaiella chishuiensis]|uniref:3-methyladenine DNA glycosylase AlkC n=1 Tax=Taibaiella chishuiensis TaxID=1434707 RepID=A0A2P8CVY1_9BACT|nr:DNA alkylation repair protein [Taibaiella chishuiensis]PSK89105.1 3-methyladenine DNA glycosylase AlkC [Taibaiella chishuiensis]
MASLLKDIYSPVFYNRLADSLAVSLPGFSKPVFLEAVLSKGFESMELKERMRHTTQALRRFMPGAFKGTAALMKRLIDQLRRDGFRDQMLEFMFLPDYIETYGGDDYKESVKAFEYITQFITCEFAVRPFIIRYPDAMMAQMLVWSQHKHDQVRRLSSEGCRPRLPWAMALPALKKDPQPVLPILENLKNDPAEFVRRSVANNLNDIAKDNPDTVIAIAAKWKGISRETDALIKHGSRTLLKQGHSAILEHYGLSGLHAGLSGFTILTPAVKTGNKLHFTFSVNNKSKVAQTIRLEYAVYYRKQNGSLNRKVFKISERTYQAGETALIERRQSFEPITTRRYHPGLHRLAIILNGEEKEILDFMLES